MYREHDKELTNNPKLQQLFCKSQCSELSNCVASLESEHNLYNLMFDKVINHITTILIRLQSSSCFASISSTGSRVDTSSRGRGRGRDGERGRGRDRGKDSPNKRKWVAPEIWKNMSEQGKSNHLSNNTNKTSSL